MMMMMIMMRMYNNNDIAYINQMAKNETHIKSNQNKTENV